MSYGRNKAYLAINGEFETASAAITLSAGYGAKIRAASLPMMAALRLSRDEAPMSTLDPYLPVATGSYGAFKKCVRYTTPANSSCEEMRYSADRRATSS